MEIFEILGLPIPMVPHFHNRNVYFKRKLRVWRTQKCIALVHGKPHLSVWVYKLPRFMGGTIGPRMEICDTSGLPIPMVPRLHQSNGYIKRKIRVWRAQKCLALVGAETVTVLTSTGPHPPPFFIGGGQYRVGNGNMQNFRPTNPHGTAFAPKQWLYEKEDTGLERSKMFYPSRCRNSTYQCGAVNYPV